MNSKSLNKITVIGPPGTGKTTALTRIYKHLTGDRSNDVVDFIQGKKLDRVLTKKYDIKEIVFISFTTSARRVLEERGVHNVYTLHSFVSKVLWKNRLLTTGSFMNDPFRAAMLENRFGWDFRDRHSNHPSNVAENKYVYYFNTYYDKDDAEILEIISENEPQPIYERIRTYIEWRKEKGVIDYTETLRRFLKYNIKTLKTSDNEVEPRVFIFDEAQDFSPLQWAVVRKLIEFDCVEVAIVAGDYNQSIYGFQGASPREFLEFKNNSFAVVLDRSYRLPRAVYVAAEMLTRKMGTHVDYQPRADRGVARKKVVKKLELQKLDGAFVEDILKIVRRAENEGKSVFILLRTNNMARKFEKHLIKAGYNIERIKDDISSFMLIKQAYTFEKERFVGEDLYYAVMSLDDKGIELMKELGPAGADYLSEYFVEGRTSIDNDAIYDAADYFERNYLKIFDKDEIEILEALRENGRKDFTVFVDTQHASKGEEADIVIVIDYVNNKIKHDIEKSEERLKEEMRVLYVAMTRAREELYVFTTDSKRSILPYARF